jgi:phospholipid transport system substrate-binding protein
MRRVLEIALAVLVAGPWLAAAAAAESPARRVVSQTADEILVILQDESLTDDVRRDRIIEIAHARFDYPTVSRLVLARNWKRLSQPQQQEFMREFREYLAHHYGSRIQRYEQQSVEVVGERAEKRGDVTVFTRIKRSGLEDIEVDYRLRERDGTWRVIDVKIEGISLVSNYRDQFKEVISRGGPDELLRKLREKNIEGVTEAS